MSPKPNAPPGNGWLADNQLNHLPLWGGSTGEVGEGDSSEAPPAKGPPSSRRDKAQIHLPQKGKITDSSPHGTAVTGEPPME
jgi:hypothetical protein